MSLKTITIGAALLAFAVPAAAQERGTVEFGAFGSAGWFNKSLTLDRGIGAGGRIGIYLDPTWSVEIEKGEMKATRTLGLTNVNVGTLTARLTKTAIQSGAFSFMIGGGAATSTETNFLHSYGVNALVGAKIALNDYAAIRVDGISDWLANYDWKSHQTLHVGLSFYRSPNVQIRNIETVRNMESVRRSETMATAPCFQRPDSVDATEQNRLRRIEREYRELRDSLNRPMLPVSTADSTTMTDRIMFEFDKSELSPASLAILDQKLQVFRDNPQLKIEITGHTGNIGTDEYNMSLGVRRAESARAYLISKGIDGSRIMIDSKGENEPAKSIIGTAVGMTENIPNRRDMFKLILIAEPVVKKP